MNKEQKEKEMERMLAIDEQFPHVKVFVNIFYELVSIQGFILSDVEKGLEKYKTCFNFEDKKKFTEIQRLFDAIIKRNDEMNCMLFTMNREDCTNMRSDANDLIRMILLLNDRCGLDRSRWNFFENYVRTMPSSGMVSDDIIDRFHLR